MSIAIALQYLGFRASITTFEFLAPLSPGRNSPGRHSCTETLRTLICYILPDFGSSIYSIDKICSSFQYF